MQKYILSAMVNNRFGVLTRISGLFARRGYNIKSLTVGETQDAEVSRMTIEFIGDDYTLAQITAQLRKVEDVKRVDVLENNSSVCRELFLIKVKADDSNRSSVLQIAEIFRARTVDVSSKSVIFEITGDEEKLLAFVGMMDIYGIIELSRTGVTAISRGTNK